MNDGYYDAFVTHPDPARRVGWTNTLEQAVRFEVVRAIISPTDSLVDLGCGSGALLTYLRDSGWQGHYTGIDTYPHPFREDKDASWHRQDFTDLKTLDADMIVALGAMVGNTTPTAFADILKLLVQARRGYVFAGVHPHWLQSGIHDPALTAVSETDIQRVLQRGATIVPTLESDLCLIGGVASPGITPRTLFQDACLRCIPSPGERARVAVRLGLEDEIIALNQSHPTDEEVQLAHERWKSRIISLA